MTTPLTHDDVQTAERLGRRMREASDLLGPAAYTAVQERLLAKHYDPAAGSMDFAAMGRIADGFELIIEALR